MRMSQLTQVPLHVYFLLTGLRCNRANFQMLSMQCCDYISGA